MDPQFKAQSRSINDIDWGALTPLLGSSSEYPLLGIFIAGLCTAAAFLSRRAAMPHSQAVALMATLVLAAIFFLIAAYRGIRAGGIRILFRRPPFMGGWVAYTGRPPVSEVPIVALTNRAAVPELTAAVPRMTVPFGGLRAMTPSSSKASFSALAEAVEGRCVLLFKVRLIDVPKIATAHLDPRWQARAARTRVDFVLCDPQTMTPIVALDLASARPDHGKREALRAVGLALETAQRVDLDNPVWLRDFLARHLADSQATTPMQMHRDAPTEAM
jgi:hypothetical protein